jgi:hypothetical protein
MPRCAGVSSVSAVVCRHTCKLRETGHPVATVKCLYAGAVCSVTLVSLTPTLCSHQRLVPTGVRQLLWGLHRGSVLSVPRPGEGCPVHVSARRRGWEGGVESNNANQCDVMSLRSFTSNPALNAPAVGPSLPAQSVVYVVDSLHGPHGPSAFVSICDNFPHWLPLGRCDILQLYEVYTCSGRSS